MDSFITEDFIKILYAIIAGGLIGFEREYRDKSAGLRTLMFISIGTTVFTLLSVRYAGGDPSRVAAGLVTGIGFIGTGVIRRNNGRVDGITTAAIIWVTAGIGMAIGQGSYNIALIALIVTLILLWLLPLLEFGLTPQREAVLYSITMRKDEELLKEIKREIVNNKIKIIDETYEKDNDKIIVNISILGYRKAHHEINKYFIENPNIEKCILL